MIQRISIQHQSCTSPFSKPSPHQAQPRTNSGQASKNTLQNPTINSTKVPNLDAPAIRKQNNPKHESNCTSRSSLNNSPSKTQTKQQFRLDQVRLRTNPTLGASIHFLESPNQRNQRLRSRILSPDLTTASA
ncbi:hypothetical protein Droror1_Dr00003872 [Drosera rotundifolia]